MAFERVTAARELWDGDMQQFSVGGKRVLVLRVQGRVYAYENRCAHLGLPLDDGTLEQGVITCRAHHFTYDACSGRGLNPRNVCLRSFAVREEGDWVAVDIGREAS